MKTSRDKIQVEVEEHLGTISCCGWPPLNQFIRHRIAPLKGLRRLSTDARIANSTEILVRKTEKHYREAL